MASNPNVFNTINDKNLEQCVVTFLEKVDSLEKSRALLTKKSLPRAQTELRTLQLWRSIISECLAAFLYVFIVCGATSTSATAGSFPQTSFVTAAASGFSICVLTYCFQNLSGAHINPAISVSMIVSRKITPLRGMLFVAAQSGGAIAGAALLYGVTIPAHYGNLNATVSQISPPMSPWERVCIEFVLTFLLVFTYCVTMHGHRKWLGSSAMCMGLAYFSTGLVSMPTQNPARAFGPAFVMNRWDHHWVFWFGPCAGGLVASLVFEVIFITHQKKSRSEMSVDGDSVSIHSEADTYDDFAKSRGATAMRPANPNPYTRQIPPPSSGHNGNSYCSAFYPMSLFKPERSEPIYEGSRSMYTRSPPLTRANLSRSQSVYTKTANGPHMQPREHIRPGGPLYPSQSLYPMMPTSQNTNPINQNHQNQQRQGAAGGENIYGAKPREIYGKIPGGGGRNDYGHSGMKKQDTSDSTYSSYGMKKQDTSDSTYSSYGMKKQDTSDSTYNSSYGTKKQDTSDTNYNSSYGMKKQQQDLCDSAYGSYGMKKQDSSENTYNSYISSSSSNSKMPSTHMPRKDGHGHGGHSHQNGISPAESPYYHSQSSPNSQY